MKQRNLTLEEQQKDKETFPEMFKHRLTTAGGYTFGPRSLVHTDDTPEQRRTMFEELWEMVGLPLPYFTAYAVPTTASSLNTLHSALEH